MRATSHLGQRLLTLLQILLNYESSSQFWQYPVLSCANRKAVFVQLSMDRGSVNVFERIFVFFAKYHLVSVSWHENWLKSLFCYEHGGSDNCRPENAALAFLCEL